MLSERPMADRQTVLIGTRTHTPPDSISSRLRLCVTHVTMTNWVYIGSSRVWKCTTPHPLSPVRPLRLCNKPLTPPLPANIKVLTLPRGLGGGACT